MSGGIGNVTPEGPKPGDITFHPMKVQEWGFPSGFGGMQIPQSVAVRPKHSTYCCGHCGDTTNGRVLCETIRTSDGAHVLWCICSCDKSEPSVITEKEGDIVSQIPLAKVFHSEPDWPPDLATLYEEAATSYSAGAFTSASMVCRKLLMACACDKGDAEGRKFVQYVDYITDEVLTYSDAKTAIEKIKDIGNEANHKISFVNKVDAERALKIVTYLLRAVYSLPGS